MFLSFLTLCNTTSFFKRSVQLVLYTIMKRQLDRTAPSSGNQILNCRTVLQVRPRPLPTTSFSTQYSLLFYCSILSHSEELATSLNKIKFALIL
jgi:hypothetical protein